MKPKMHVVLGLCLVTVASLLLFSASNGPKNASAEPIDAHSVNEALNHALIFAEQHYNLPGLTRLAWTASVDNHPDLSYATHHIFINQPETIGELQAQFAINPAHSGFVTDQITIIVHAPDDPHFSHQITLIDSEKHIVWSAKIDLDGHVTEYMHYE